jgi:hypothetical protein
MADVTDHSDNVDRGATELILGALAGSTLLPFIQEVAKKAGEDAYQLLRDKLSRRGSKNAKAEIRETGAVTVAGHDSRVVLQMPERITDTIAGHLANVRLPVDRVGWLLVTWDATQLRWIVENIPEPPPATNTLES